MLQRVQGNTTLKTPGNNYFEPVQDISETAWKKHYPNWDTQSEWMDFLQQLKTEQLELTYPVNQ
ncbi:MAG: hypothetical protein IPL27_28320 [Lewinellaceae bacterium]|nr:hypothetical protein [Lewinellaceae bacterium]